jgi:hypothetical protein
MWYFLVTLLFLILLTLVIQVISKMKLIPPSKLAVVHGRDRNRRRRKHRPLGARRSARPRRQRAPAQRR